MERQRTVSVSPAKAAFLSLDKKWICFPSLSLLKSISRLSSPSRNFCAHGLSHILPRSQALEEKAAKAPEPFCHDLGSADRPSIFSLFPWPRRERERGHIPPKAGGIGMGLAQEAQSGSKSLHSNFPIILTQLMSPSTASSAARLMWNMPFCSFKPVLVRHGRRRLSRVAMEKQCSKSATAVLMRLVSLLWLCHYWGHGMGWTLSVHQDLRAREGRNIKCVFVELLQACRFSGHNWGCWSYAWDLNPSTCKAQPCSLTQVQAPGLRAMFCEKK